MRITDHAGIKTLGTILGVWAHPDDESWAMAGIMAMARRNGQRVACVTATHGELGVQDEKRWPASQLADIRQGELDVALDILGVDEHYWFDYKDGCCADVKESEAVALVAAIMEQVQPDTVMSFGPDGLTGHPDHSTTSRWARQALVKTGRRRQVKLFHAVETTEWYETAGKELDARYNMFFNIDEPPHYPAEQIDLCVQLPPDILDLKFDAMRAQASQMERLMTEVSHEIMRDTFRHESFMRVPPPELAKPR